MKFSFSLRSLLLVSVFGPALIVMLWAVSNELYGPFNGPVYYLSSWTTPVTEAKILRMPTPPAVYKD